jgi:hypothetical protein
VVSKKTASVQTLIVRGIGYRAFALNNDLLKIKNEIDVRFLQALRPVYTETDEVSSAIISKSSVFEFPGERYLVIRAGHTRDMYVPLADNIKCLTSKKDRKLVVLSHDKTAAANTAKAVYAYREPSVYTGRGVRIKHVRPIRKAGKKDKQKGKAF